MDICSFIRCVLDLCSYIAVSSCFVVHCSCVGACVFSKVFGVMLCTMLVLL